MSPRPDPQHVGKGRLYDADGKPRWKGPMDGPPPGLAERLANRKRSGTRLKRPKNAPIPIKESE